MSILEKLANSPLPPAPVTAPEPLTFRDFGDADSLRKSIFDKTLDAARNIKPVANARYSLALENVDYEDPEEYPIARQKQAILEGTSLSRRLRGDWVLKDVVAGNELERRRATVAAVPYLTPRGSFIINGSARGLATQMRLRAGMYARRRKNGLLEANSSHIPGTGMSHHYELEPESGVFKMNFAQSGIPLLPVLRAFGVTDQQVRDAWGDELFAVNAKKADPSALDKLYKRLVRKPDAEATAQTKSEAVAAALRKMEFDPEVNQRTLGHPYKNLDADVILAATKKLLDLNRGIGEEDDRDHLAYQKFMGPEDLIAERVRRSAPLLNQLLWKASTRGSLKTIPVGAFDKHIRAATFDSGLSQCFDAETKALTRRGFVLWPDVTEDDEFACWLDDKLAYRRPHQLLAYDYEGGLIRCRTKQFSYLVTPNHRLWCRVAPRGKVYREETAEAAFGKYRAFQTSLPPEVETTADPDFVVPGAIGNRWGNLDADRPIDGDVWAKFLGWFISEGWVSVEPANAGKDLVYKICVCQDPAVHREHWEALAAVLAKMPYNWNYNRGNKTFYVRSKSLGLELLKCGDGAELKRIPRYCFNWSNRRLKLLAETYMKGDGRATGEQASTASPGLADDLVELAGRIGMTGLISISRLSLKRETWSDSHVVSFSHKQETTSQSDADRKRLGIPGGCSRQLYCGKVYCASVPGEKLYVMRDGKPHWSLNSLTEINPLESLDQQGRVTRLGPGGISSIDSVPDSSRNVHSSQIGFIDLVKSPESNSSGIDSRFGHAAKRGSDGRVYTPYTDPKTGQQVYKSPQDVADMTLAFPGELESGEEHIQALVKGRPRYVTRDKVDLVLPHATSWFSPVTNLVPLKNAAKGQRVSMGARFTTQALQLVNPEAPLVRINLPGTNKSFEEEYAAHAGAIFAAKQPGRVASVDKNGVTVQYADGSKKVHELYEHFPYNTKSYLHNTPVVQPGDEVQPGQLLAKSNYTDDKGHIALGLNARTAYMIWEGKNHEDAKVISESFAKRLASEQLYQHTLDLDKTVKTGKKDFAAIFAAKYGKQTLDTLDDDGVIKPGTTVKYGDPLILAAVERPVSAKTVHASHKGSYADRSVTWEHQSDGIVTDVAKTSKGLLVAVRSATDAIVGDKLSNKYGGKGVIAEVVPTERMPRDPKTGLPYELLESPLGIQSRSNADQKHEAWLAKIAARTGKPYVLNEFDGRDLTKFAEDELSKHGMTGIEDVYHPGLDRNIPVSTGLCYILKLHHLAEGKSKGRGLGSYDAEERPVRGGDTGALKLAMMNINAYLSHGAIRNLKAASLIGGQKNHEYWSTFMSGFRPATPSVPLVYRKFIDQLRASGVNVQRNGSQLNIMALTDKDIDHLAENREITNAETVDWRENLKPIPGGLFDTATTGSHGGKKWSYVRLYEPMLNPVFEDPARHMLGLTAKQLEAVISGEAKLEGKTGTEAIRDALAGINVAKEIAAARDAIKHGRKGAREIAVRKLGYLKAAEATGVHPKEWVLSKVPVIPPIFRPVSMMQTGQQLVADGNYLYKELVDANQNLKDVTGKLDDISEERRNLYLAFKAVVGLGDPIQPKNQERKVKGFLAQVFGSSPKFSAVQSKLLGKPQDLVGRAAIIPNPDLSMDEIGIPESHAWEAYAPFLVRRLVKQGVPRHQALEHIDKKSPMARKALLAELDERPVAVNRAPVLHRYGEMAFYPRLVKGHVIHLSPLVEEPYGSDFDGDGMNYRVIADDDAAKEAIDRMLPSRNLIAVSNFKKPNYSLRHDYLGGVFAATSAVNKNKQPRVFATGKDAARAFWNGELDPSDPIVVVDEKEN